MASNNVQISTLQGQLASSTSQNSALQNQVSFDSTQISSLQGQLSSATSQVASLQTQVSTNNSQISRLQSQHSTDATQISTLQNQSSSYQSQITSLQSQISSLQSQISSGRSYQTTLFSSQTISQGPYVQTLVYTFTPTYSGISYISGTSSSSTGYISVTNTTTGASNPYTFGTGTTISAPLIAGNNYSIYFGNHDSVGTITATLIRDLFRFIHHIQSKYAVLLADHFSGTLRANSGLYFHPELFRLHHYKRNEHFFHRIYPGN